MTPVTKQTGAASSTPSPVYRWLTSRLLTRIASKRTMDRQRAKAEKRRKRQGLNHRVEYFHQVGDGYSHLAAQLLEALATRYDIDLVCHLVRAETGANTPEPELLQKLSVYDAKQIAKHYGLTPPGTDTLPTADLQDQACRILASLSAADFARIAPKVEAALWRGDEAAMASLAAAHGCATAQETQTRLTEGTDRRRALGHYSGAMFHYGGEWYWGVDRLYHLEERLADLGADTRPGTAALAPKPSAGYDGAQDTGALTLEYYVSLRSPYTAVSWEPTMALAAASGVKLVVKPVLPMVMRGVPATRQKGLYIFRDAAREARANGVPYGKVYDPIGDPVTQCYALYPWACEQDKGAALLGAFLKAAFVLGINTNRWSGLRQVVEDANLDWSEAQRHLNDESWQPLLEQNRQDMYDFGSWGVPSYRLLDENHQQLLGVWGQDRLWLVSKMISSVMDKRNA